VAGDARHRRAARRRRRPACRDPDQRPGRFRRGPERGTNWHEHFRIWRKRRLREIEVEYGDRLDEVAEFLAEFASKVKALGPAGYLRSTAYRAGEPVNLGEED
jgi:hypothetical protein